MPGSVDERRKFYKLQTGATKGALADLEAQYYSGVRLGTVPATPVATATVVAL